MCVIGTANDTGREPVKDSCRAGGEPPRPARLDTVRCRVAAASRESGVTEVFYWYTDGMCCPLCGCALDNGRACRLCGYARVVSKPVPARDIKAAQLRRGGGK